MGVTQSRIKALIEGSGENPAPFIARMAQGLELAGVDFLVIPCNTAHKYYEDVVAAVNIPVVSILDVTVAFVRQRQPGIKKVGLLASTAVKKFACTTISSNHWPLNPCSLPVNTRAT